MPTSGEENCYDSIKWLNEVEEQYRIEHNLYMNEVMFEGEWECKNHPKFEDLYDPNFCREQETRMAKFPIYFKLRKGIESLDTYDYE